MIARKHQLTLLVAGLSALAFFVTPHRADAVTIDTMPVGNPGNAPDTRYNSISVGSVAGAYRIGKYEVTAGQYTEFLNAVAKADPNGLYNPSMVSLFGANIQRSGSSPNFTYSVASDWANRPVNYVSFWNAARFTNWLHNGQPTGAQGPGTTEGGAYHDIGDDTLFGRNAGAKFFIPTEDEWYKAAYHKNDGVTGNYWDYPTASNTTPINTLPDPGNHANFYDGFGTGNNGFTIGSPYYRTEAGAFANSASPYGTFDQAGNVFEWNETAVTDSSRGFRGGSFIDNSPTLHASDREYYFPHLDGNIVGFRVATVPEPSSIVHGADFTTAIPGGTGNFTSLPTAPGYSSSGKIAFYGGGSGGQQGIYVSIPTETHIPPNPVKIADLNTAIPSGTGNFTSFIPPNPVAPAIDGDNVAFYGEGSGGQQGIYVLSSGPPIRIADAATAIPDGTGSFTAFKRPGIPPNPVISGDNVAFFGTGSGGQEGIYGASVSNSGPPIRIADTATAIPGGTGNFTAFATAPSLSGDSVAFLGEGSGGQQGIFHADVQGHGPPIKAADLNTAIPGGSGNFTSFIPPNPVAPAIDGTSVAFFGAGSGGQQGVYVSNNGPPIKVADTSTAIPSGAGNFTSFGNVSISDAAIAFVGTGASGQQGIYILDYVAANGPPIKVIDLNDILNGSTITSLNLSSTALFGDPIAFQATFADGSQGLYVWSVPPLDGDFNGDHNVDAADYVVWRKNPGGVYTPDDYTVWRANFGRSFFNGNGADASASATVPEPATFVLLTFAAAGWCLRRVQHT